MGYIISPISVPEYYSKFVDPTVDLNSTPKICCPFHRETSPSFSYDARTGRWTCFGACKASGDAIEMHRRFRHLPTREVANDDLRVLLRLPKLDLGTSLAQIFSEERSNEEAERIQKLTVTAVQLAKSDNDFLKLCSILSVNPPVEEELEDFIWAREV